MKSYGKHAAFDNHSPVLRIKQLVSFRKQQKPLRGNIFSTVLKLYLVMIQIYPPSGELITPMSSSLDDTFSSLNNELEGKN